MFQLITFIVYESYKELLLRNALRSLVYILFDHFFFVAATHPSRIRKNSSSGVLERLNSVDALVVVHPFFNAQSRISKLPSSVAF